jgi:DNA-binding transcriptional LysR family regulator
MAQIDWNDVRYFVALATAGGLSKAADVLGVSHVTVMRRVRALETSLGADLFVRRHDGHRLTAIGAELLHDAREGGELIAAALQRAASSSAELNVVRIATTEIVANWILLPYLAQVPTAPRIEIDASPAERSLLDEEATIAIRFRRPTNGPFRIRKLATIDIALYASADDMKVEDSSYIGWAGDFEHISLARWVRRCFADAPARLALTSIEGHRSAAVAGLGIAALPRFLADRDTRLRPIRTDEEPLKLTAWLTLPEALRQKREVRAAVKLIDAAFGAAGLG